MKNVLTMMLAGMLLVSSTFAFAEDVYATKNGKRYHKINCLLIKDKGAKPIALEEAQKKGLKPCHRCFGSKTESVSGAKVSDSSAVPADQTSTK